MRLSRRRCLLLAASPLLAQDDLRQQLVDVVGSMASALGEDNPAAFMRYVSRDMPDYENLAQSVMSLRQGAEVSSSVSLLEQEGDATQQRIVVDWRMQLRSLALRTVVEQRRESLRLTLQRKELLRKSKDWRVTALSPVAFFRPH